VTTEIRSPSSAATYEELPPKERRLRLLAALVRPIVGGILLLVLYFVLPLDQPVDAVTALMFAAGLAAVAVLVVVQVRQIVHSRYPRVRAIGAIAITIPTFLVLFATVYYLIAQNYADSFTEPLSRVDSLYFTITVFSTVGFGDIAPKLQAARIVAMVQMIGDLALLGLIGKVLIGAVSLGLQRTQRPNP
jgi:voltage-gated potassium channel